MGRLEDSTQQYLDTLHLADHQRPIATLALELAKGLDRKRTAASAKEFRATIDALTPTTAHRAQADANADEITGAGANPPAPAPALTPARHRALEVLASGAAADRPVFDSNRTDDAGDRLTIYWQSRHWLHQHDLIRPGDLEHQWELTPAGTQLAQETSS